MTTQHVAVYLRSSRNSRTPFLGRFIYGTEENFITFREKVLLTCPEIRGCNWQMHWVDNNLNLHGIVDDSSFYYFEGLTFRRPKKIYISMLQRCRNRNLVDFESAHSNYLCNNFNNMLSTISDPSNNQGNGNQQRTSNQYHRQAHIDRALNIMTSAMGFSNEGDGLASLLEAVDGNISMVLDVLEQKETIPVPL